MRPLLLASVAVAIAGMTMIQPAHAFTVPLPSSMASTGDSITRAYDINWFHLLSDSPQYSWSTGYNGSVTSQYEHILALNPAISGHEFNDAKTGAKMVDLDGQVKNAASQEAQYLTVLMGANDLCTSSTATMTSTATFGTQFRQALNDFFIADPTAHVYVSSLPNLYQLWSVLHTNSSARNVWSTFGICQSMLRNSNTESQRQAVVARESADNQILLNACVQYANCRWDNYAGYNLQFPASDISTVDYFHPNIHGQNDIARVTWAASYWAS
jgi:lysophospholipase L1-like esterase